MKTYRARLEAWPLPLPVARLRKAHGLARNETLRVCACRAQHENKTKTHSTRARAKWFRADDKPSHLCSCCTLPAATKLAARARSAPAAPSFT